LLKSLRILVIKISSVGDVVLVTASLKAIREKFPYAKIFCLVGKESREILQRCPYVDELIVFDVKDTDKGFKGLLRIAGKLRRHKIDKVIDFQNNRISHLLSLLSFSPESYGYDNGKFGFLLSHRIKDIGAIMPPVEHQFQILNMLGISCDTGARLELWPSKQDEEYIQGLWDAQWLGQGHPIVGINIAASQRWKSKNWPIHYVARLCDILAGKGLRVVVTGTEKDRDALNELLRLTKAKPAVFVGKTGILQLASLIKRCAVYVTMDSAPMHIAASVGTPFLAFFGPTDYHRHLPPAETFRVLRKSLPCAPCYSPQCKIKTHDCMNLITPDEVAREIASLMALVKKTS